MCARIHTRPDGKENKMEREKNAKPTIGIWDSAKQLLEFSTWLPEVVGPAEDILRMGLYRKNPDGQRRRLTVARG